MVEKLELALAERGWTQSAFEKRAMLSANRISKWKSGKGEPTARQALRMARLLDVSVDYLIDDDQDQPIPTPSTDRDRAIWDIIAEIGPDRAWRRLVGSEDAGGDWEPHPLPSPAPKVRRDRPARSG